MIGSVSTKWASSCNATAFNYMYLCQVWSDQFGPHQDYQPTNVQMDWFTIANINCCKILWYRIVQKYIHSLPCMNVRPILSLWFGTVMDILGQVEQLKVWQHLIFLFELLVPLIEHVHSWKQCLPLLWYQDIKLSYTSLFQISPNGIPSKLTNHNHHSLLSLFASPVVHDISPTFKLNKSIITCLEWHRLCVSANLFWAF